MTKNISYRSHVVAVLPIGNCGLLKLPEFKVGSVKVFPRATDYYKEIGQRLILEGSIAERMLSGDIVAGANLVFEETVDLPIDELMSYSHMKLAVGRVMEATRILSLTGFYPNIVPTSCHGGLMRRSSFSVYCHCNSNMDVVELCMMPGYHPINVSNVPENASADEHVALVRKILLRNKEHTDQRLHVALRLYDQMMTSDVYGTGWITRVTLGITALETLFVRQKEVAYIWSEDPWERMKKSCFEYPRSFERAREVLRLVRNDVIHRGGFTREGDYGSTNTGGVVCIVQTLLRYSLRQIMIDPSILKQIHKRT